MQPRASHTSLNIHDRRLSGYTFQGSILERFEFVEEVVVLVTVVEVGVHADGRGTRDGSGTRFSSKLQRR